MKAWLATLATPELLAVLAVGAAVAAFAGAVLFAKIASSVLAGGDATSVDQRVSTWMLDHRSDLFTDLLRPVTHLADGKVVTVVTLVAVILLAVRRRWWLAGFLVVVAIGTPVLVQTVKAIVDRPRPAASNQLVEVTGAAFPSGHAAQSIGCYVAIAVVIGWVTRSRRWAIVAGLVAGTIVALVGISRVYLGVHWTSDVVAGWTLGISWLAASSAALVLWATLRHGSRGLAAGGCSEP